MKTKLLVSIFALFVFASCSSDDVKELLTTTQEFTASESFTVSVPEGDILTFSDSKDIDASLTGVDITEVEILSITGSITDVVAPNGDVNLTSATLTLVGTGVSLELNDVALTTGTAFNFTFNNIPAAQIDIIESYILLNSELTIEASATVDNSPVDFKLNVEFKIDATGTVI